MLGTSPHHLSLDELALVLFCIKGPEAKSRVSKIVRHDHNLYGVTHASGTSQDFALVRRRNSLGLSVTGQHQRDPLGQLPRNPEVRHHWESVVAAAVLL
jgi:hypothetical protein